MPAKRSLFRPRWSKVIADLWVDRTRTLLVVASIAVGAFAIGAIASAFVILSEDMDISFAAVNPANISIYTYGFDASFLESVETMAGVADAEGRHELVVNIIQEGKPANPLSLVAIEDMEGVQINLLQPKSGQTIPGEREMVLGFDPLKFPDFVVGDVLTIELPNGDLRQISVVGEVVNQGVGADPWSPSVGYITFETLDWLGEPWLNNRLLVTVDGDRNDDSYIESVAENIEDKIENSGRPVWRSEWGVSGTHPMGDILVAVLGVLGALGLMVMFLSVSLIVNTLNALLAQGRRQIGVMKLIGGRSHQILAMYMVMILIFGVLALGIAVPAGAWAGYALSQFIGGMLNAELQGYRTIRIVVIIQAVVSILVPMAAGFMPVIRGARTTVRRALSNDRQSSAPKSSGVGQRVWSLFRWLSRPILLSIRNTFRRRDRLLLTLLTLSVSGALFIGVFSVQSSLQDYMDRMVKYFLADLTLQLERPYRISTVEQAVMEVEGIEIVEAWATSTGELLDENGEVVEYLSVLAPPSGSQLIEPIVSEGRWLLPGDDRAIAVAESIRRNSMPDVKPGDTLRLKVAGGPEEEWTLVGLLSFPAFTDDDEPAYVPLEALSGSGIAPSKVGTYRLVTTDHSEAAQVRIGEALEKHMLEQGFDVLRITTGSVLDEQMVQLLGILVTLLLIMAFLTAVVGSIGLTGTMGMNVLERTREIGVMRAIGAVDSAITKSVIIEGAFIGLISWAIAVPLSFPIGSGVLSIIATAMRMGEVNLSFDPQGIGIWLGLVMVLTVLASVMPARNAARLTIREVLAYE